MKMLFVSFLFLCFNITFIHAQVTLVSEIKISDSALYFDGEHQQKSENAVNRQDGKYDFAFGRRITPHGDCIKKHGDYLFLTWYH